MTFNYYFWHYLWLTQWQKMNVPQWYSVCFSLAVIGLIILFALILLVTSAFIYYLIERNKNAK